VDNKYWKLLFSLGISLIFFLPPIDTDLGWHLRYGKYFWQTGKFLTTNKFTLLLYDYQWSHSYSFYQILSFLIFKLAKFSGLSLCNSVIFLLAFYFLYLILAKSLYKTVAASLLIAFLSWNVFGLGWRAQIFSFLGTILTFYLLKSPQKKFFLPLVFLFWVNFHGGFVLGLMIFFIYLLLLLIKVIIKKNNIKLFLITLFNFCLSVLATFINPYKVKVWWEAWHHLKVPMNTLIAEWTAPTPIFSFFIIITFFFCFLIFFLEKNKNFEKWFLLICLFPFLYFSLSARRNVVFFFLNASLIIFSSSFAKKWNKNLNFISFNKALIILIFSLLILFQIPRTFSVNISWNNHCQERKRFPFPCQAVDFLKVNGIKGNFYNTYEWGGFLEWQLPESKFFVDGRMPAWSTPSGKSPYTIYLEIIQSLPGWQETLKKYKIDHLFIANGTFLDLELKARPQKYSWKEIYRDKKAVIYEKYDKVFKTN